MFMVPTLESHPIRIMEDNKGAIKMTNKKFSSNRTRPIDVKHHIVFNVVGAGRVRIICVKTDVQRADVLMKAVEKSSYMRILC